MTSAILRLLAALALSAPPEDDPAARFARWNEDLTALATELPRRHANFHHTLSPADFSAGIDRIRAVVPRMTDDQVLTEIARLLARVWRKTETSNAPRDERTFSRAAGRKKKGRSRALRPQSQRRKTYGI